MNVLDEERRHLSHLLEALQRCAYFLDYSERKMAWPLLGDDLSVKRKDTELFETLAAINERFAKLQDTLAVAMRHTALLMSEESDSFLKVLSLFEKLGVLESSEEWQQSRMARNIAAHDYETNYEAIAEHFNTLESLSGMLFRTARNLVARAEADLGIQPATGDFTREFERLFD